MTLGKNVNMNVTNIPGGTPLNFCALNDNFECARILLKHGAQINSTCENGYFPVHLAAFKGSNKVLNIFFEEGLRLGISKEKLLSFTDADNNKPLHSAVQVNNILAVKLCLINGSKIDETTDTDNLTPIHVACSQGSLEILVIMLENQPQLKEKVINMKDINQMTPLHKASMFDHVEIVDYLLKNGANINATDEENRTPILLAASRNCVEVVCYLLKEQNCNYKLKDVKLRNFLHLIVSHSQPIMKKDLSRPSSTVSVVEDGNNKIKNEISYISLHSLHEVSKLLIKVIFLFIFIQSFNVFVNCFQKSDFKGLLHDQDHEGCTVMHYASKLGLVGCLKSLMENGASISTLNNHNQSPLHFAAKYGRYNSCVQILSSPNYKNYINEKDGDGNTPLHLSAQNGHSKVVKLLIEKGAMIFKSYKSYSGNNPFHEAAKNSCIECMDILFNVHRNVLDSINANGVSINDV